jgi:hypothetical protein
MVCGSTAEGEYGSPYGEAGEGGGDYEPYAVRLETTRRRLYIRRS